MADSPAVPGSSGFNTSEFSLARLVIVIGVLLESAAGALHALQDNGISAPWFTTALVVMGVALQACAALGYIRGRSMVKVATAMPAVSDNDRVASMQRQLVQLTLERDSARAALAVSEGKAQP